MTKNKHKTILGVKLDKAIAEKVLEKIKRFLLSDGQHYIITLNPEMIIEAQKDDYFKKIINEADIVTVDGTGILLALDYLEEEEKPIRSISSILKLLFCPDHRKNILKYRTQGIDLIHKICKADFAKDKKIYLLGAGEGIAEEAARVLLKKYNYLNIIGAEEGIRFEMSNVKCQMSNELQNSKFTNNFSFEKGGLRGISEDDTKYNELNNKLIERISNAKPDIIFVAFGMPKQEKWIYENLKNMPSVKLAMGVGGSFDFISKKIKRAPLIFQKLGLEWAWRLMLEPRRIKRIYNATVKFGWMVWKEKIKYKY